MGEYVKDGDCYIVGPNLMIWDSTTNMWRGISISAGPSGETATIEVGSTRTGDESSEALALDNVVGNHHVFDFVIPRGDKGESGPTGPKGDKGDTGPIGSLVLTSYDAVCFASFKVLLLLVLQLLRQLELFQVILIFYLFLVIKLKF